MALINYIMKDYKVHFFSYKLLKVISDSLIVMGCNGNCMLKIFMMKLDLTHTSPNTNITILKYNKSLVYFKKIRFMFNFN